MKQLDLLDLMPDDTPGYMADAWLSCVLWAAGTGGVVEAYRQDTGDTYQPPSLPIEQIIDEATGRQERFVRDFVAWFNTAVWGPVDGKKDNW